MKFKDLDILEGLNPNVVEINDIVSYFMKLNNNDVKKAIESAKAWGKRAIAKSSDNTNKVNEVIRHLKQKTIH
jgi:hypothetical protein